MTSVTVVGEALVDLVADPDAPGRFTAHPGGSPYNVAITLARLGVPTTLVARIGRDTFGRLLTAKGRASGIDLTAWQEVAEPTTLAVAGLDSRGRAEYEFYADGTAAFGWDTIAVADTRMLHVGSLASWLPRSADRVLAAQRDAAAAGALISYDPNVRPSLLSAADARDRAGRSVSHAHVVKASDEDVAYLYPGEPLAAVAGRWCRLGAALVVVTRGADGAIGFGPDGVVADADGVPVQVADTVGAGDSFTGGLLAALGDLGLDTPDAVRAAPDGAVQSAIERAVLVSAITCERPGADPPTAEEVRRRSG